ncbi:MAG: tyrosine--tRNA ligase [Pelagibacterales bacterium]|nr:tyrosine--tRNA ligase [Pelagibacterales bacterium]|tara:strand:+ start:16688 stop:17959 length:1272 start_codon:yes stop_codon:yes gene_type:complete
MTTYSSDFIKEIIARGFIHQATDINNLDKLLDNSHIIPAYIGFDCTASSLHVGSLIQIMLLKWFQKSGHKPIVLLGGGTSLVGDPSGKDESRKLINEDIIKSNSIGIKDVFNKFLNFDQGDNKALMVDNSEWLKNLNYIEFLRDYGKHFSINRMLTFDSVKLRLDREQTLSFLEFNYMILQAYDFYELNKRYGCKIQMGGSDQWGNIINGIELHRRVNSLDSRNPLYGLTSPLITTSSGSKMGKTANGAIWLNSNLCSPWDYWQFWRNTEDKDVIRFLKLFTEISLGEIKKLEELEGAEINDAKIILANAATTLLHGEEETKKAISTAKNIFEKKEGTANLPVISYNNNELTEGVPILECLTNNNYLLSSKGEARRLIRGSGVKINNTTVSDENMKINNSLFVNESRIKLSVGKKKHIILEKK